MSESDDLRRNIADLSDRLERVERRLGIPSGRAPEPAPPVRAPASPPAAPGPPPA
ncbi:MAG: hypothetical protein HKO59_15220, partial [Phycisphaerales bacterium]|nr:hypothetical protein [Phycisphaerales bacterium]